MKNSLTFLSKVLFGIATVPFALLASLIGPREKRTKNEVAAFLRNFLAGSGGQWDWDDFTSVQIADPRLEDVRKRAAAVELPPSETGIAALRSLLSEVEQMKIR